MSIKFNWGTGIFIFIVMFLIAMLTVVFLSFRQNNELVEAEYYPQGIEYQKQIDRMAKAKLLSAPIAVEQVSGNLVLTYPEEFRTVGFDEGKVFFYRPSAEKADMLEVMQPDSSLSQIFSLSRFTPGKYVIKLSWSMKGEQYYDEQPVMIRK